LRRPRASSRALAARAADPTAGGMAGRWGAAWKSAAARGTNSRASKKPATKGPWRSSDLAGARGARRGNVVARRRGARHPHFSGPGGSRTDRDPRLFKVRETGWLVLSAATANGGRKLSPLPPVPVSWRNAGLLAGFPSCRAFSIRNRRRDGSACGGRPAISSPQTIDRGGPFDDSRGRFVTRAESALGAPASSVGVGTEGGKALHSIAVRSAEATGNLATRF